jgi:CubicO group peptidase (beta-lactamase class C family)
MKQLSLALLFSLSISIGFSQKGKPTTYFPPVNNWQHQNPATLGLSTDAVNNAIAFAKSHEIKASRSGELSQFQSFGKEPFSNAIGPLKDRDGPAGIIIYKGYIVGEWGDPSRVDMTHSVTKSFLSTVVGLAVDRGLIHNTMDTVANYMTPIEVYNTAEEKATLFIRLHRHIIKN